MKFPVLWSVLFHGLGGGVRSYTWTDSGCHRRLTYPDVRSHPIILIVKCIELCKCAILEPISSYHHHIIPKIIFLFERIMLSPDAVSNHKSLESMKKH